MATNYDINYNDERFQDVEADKKVALNEVEKTYGEMIGQSDKYYQAQIDASKQWADKQSQLQQEQTDFAIEQIEQQKDQAKKDYTKEQSGAYVDWQKQSNQYGANAEAMAAQGMQNTGFSESAQVSMYNTYQNRVASARESYNRAVLNYDNAIKDARLQNNSVLAEIAYQALQQQLELSLQGFQYKNSLIIEQANKKQEVDNIHYQRYQDVLNQINQENALAEEVRQYNKTYEENVRQFNENYDLQIKKFNEEIRQFNEEIARLKAQDEAENAYKIQQLELQKAQLEEEKRQFDKLHSSPAGDDPALIVDKTPLVEPEESAEVEDSERTNETTQTGSFRDQRNVQPTPDIDSVIALGYGMISAAELNRLISQGIVEEYKVGNKLKYRKTAKANTPLLPTVYERLKG